MSDKPQPSLVSVVMPVYNEQRFVNDALHSILAQDYPADRIEIVVVDGMSTDSTPDIVANAARRDGRIRLLRNPSRIMSKGFNIGLSAAQGDVVIMMGGHTQLAPDYVSACSSLLRAGTADCVGGAIQTIAETTSAEAISLALSSRFGVGGVAFRLGCPEQRYVDTVAFGAYTRDMFIRAGPLDEELAHDQDDEFNYRIRKLGGRILLSPEIRCRYISRSSLRSLWRQYFRYGYWKIRVLQKHPWQMQPRHFVAAALVGSLGLCLPVLAYRPMAGIWIGGSICCLYLSASVVFSLKLARTHKKWRLLPIFPVTFAVLHFSYGTGFLYGLVRFSSRWGTGTRGASEAAGTG